MMLTVMAATASVTDAQAAQPNRPVMVQHAAPFPGAAPVFHTAPVQRVAPHVVMPPSSPPVYPNASRPVGVMPTFTQPQNNNNFQAVNPSVQHVNPNLPFNNPSALRPNLPLNNPSVPRPNLPLDNPNALRPNLPLNNPSALGTNPPSNNPNFVQGSGIAPQRPVTLKPGASQPLVNSTLLKPAPGSFQQIRPAFPAVQLHDKFWPIHRD